MSKRITHDYCVSPPTVASSSHTPSQVEISSSSTAEEESHIENYAFRLEKLSNMFAELYGSTEIASDMQLIAEIERNDIPILNNADVKELVFLGSGTIGEIWKGEWNQQPVCIQKVLNRDFNGYSAGAIKKMAIEPFWRDTNILRTLNHQNIVSLKGVVLNDTEASLKRLTELMPDASFQHVFPDRFFCKLDRLKIARDAAAAMEYMHSKGIWFYAFKSTNLLLDLTDALEPKCKVGDIGLFNFDWKNLTAQGIGSNPWRAPEYISKRINWNVRVTEKIDVFSFGIVLWELLMGEYPYKGMTAMDIDDGIKSNTLRPKVPTPYCQTDIEWGKLMKKCWDSDPEVRPSFTEIVKKLDGMCQTVTQAKPRTRGVKRPRDCSQDLLRHV